MSKSTSDFPLNTLNMNEDWGSHPVVEWLSSNKQLIIWIMLGLLALLIAAYKMIIIHNENAEADYFRAQNAFTQFQQDSLTSDSQLALTSLKQLETLLVQYPELKAAYEGPIAQTLMIMDQIPQAQTFTENIFNRTKPDHLQLFQAYSRTSLLIGEGRYDEALNQSQKLNQLLDIELATQEKTKTTLYFFNLIRLALLHQQLGHKEEELKIWESILTFSKQPRSPLQSISQLFQTGQTSLNQYAEERVRILS